MSGQLWEVTQKILDGGETLLLRSEDVYSLQALVSIPQLVNEIEANELGKDYEWEECLKFAHHECVSIFQEIQKRLNALIDEGNANFTNFEKMVKAEQAG